MRYLVRGLTLVVLAALTVSLAVPTAPAQSSVPEYSVWLVRSSVFKGVPAGAFMPDRAFIPGSTNPMNSQVFFDLPVNVGVIKSPDGKEIILYDTGWKQQDYLKMTGSINWAPLPDQLALLGIKADDVTKIVIGHGHWDHAGQLSDFPNAVLYVQREELRGIEWALSYPFPAIKAVNTDKGGCNRTPACGYPPLTLDQIYGKVLAGKAMIVDGMMEVLPGVIIHPAHRQAGVRERRVLVVGGHPRLDDRQRPADGHRPAVPGLREVLQDHRRLSELRVRARAALLLRQVSAHQELVGGTKRLAPR